MHTPYINHPTVNHTITQDPYTKEYTINIAIKIKPDTLIKEILTSARPSSYSDIAPFKLPDGLKHPLPELNKHNHTLYSPQTTVKPLAETMKCLQLETLGFTPLETRNLSSLDKQPLPAITPAQLEAFGKNHDNMSLLKNPYL